MLTGLLTLVMVVFLLVTVVRLATGTTLVAAGTATRFVVDAVEEADDEKDDEAELAVEEFCVR